MDFPARNERHATQHEQKKQRRKLQSSQCSFTIFIARNNASVSSALPHADDTEKLLTQSAFLRMNVGTSRSSTRGFAIIGRGRSSLGLVTKRGGVAGNVVADAVEATATASLSKPVAITVIFISSVIVSSMTAPKMILASSSADSRMIDEAALTSNNVRSGPPVILIKTPFAPWIVASSSSGDEIAC